jgi:hypothetical protein
VAFALVRSRVAGVSVLVEMMLRFAASPEAEYLCVTMLAALTHILDAVKVGGGSHTLHRVNTTMKLFH